MNNPITLSLLSSHSSSLLPRHPFSLSPPKPTTFRSRSRSRNSSPRSQTRHLQDTELDPDPETRIGTNENPFAELPFKTSCSLTIFRIHLTEFAQEASPRSLFLISVR